MKSAYRSYIAIVFIIGLIGTFSWAGMDPNTVAGIWLLEEGSGTETKDVSGHGQNGKITGNVNWVDGKFGMALEFPGTMQDYVEIESTPELQITGSITLMAWINTTTPVSADIVGKDNGTDRNYNIHVANSGKVFLNGGGEKCALPGVTQVADGQWHHVCGTWDWDEGTARIYVDGVEEASCPFGSPIAKSDVPVKIGLRGNGEGRDVVYRGIIDEVAIFNIALSKEEIKNLMEKGLKQLLASLEPFGKMAETWGYIKRKS